MIRRIVFIVLLFSFNKGISQQELIYGFADTPQTLLLNPGGRNQL